MNHADLPMTKMRIPFNRDGLVGETLWVTPLKHGNYRIENTPTCGFLNYRDVVKAVEDEGMLTYQRLVARDVAAVR